MSVLSDGFTLRFLRGLLKIPVEEIREALVNDSYLDQKEILRIGTEAFLDLARAQAHSGGDEISNYQWLLETEEALKALRKVIVAQMGPLLEYYNKLAPQVPTAFESLRALVIGNPQGTKYPMKLTLMDEGNFRVDLDTPNRVPSWIHKVVDVLGERLPIAYRMASFLINTATLMEIKAEFSVYTGDRVMLKIPGEHPDVSIFVQDQQGILKVEDFSNPNLETMARLCCAHFGLTVVG